MGAIYTRNIRLKKGMPLAKSFGGVSGRVQQSVIYAVVLREHPDVVKIGRTMNWRTRRKSYAAWNLNAASDAILEARLFEINEEFVDLERLEKAILDQVPAYRVFGSEWFKAELDEICRLIDSILCCADLTYTLHIEAGGK